MTITSPPIWTMSNEFIVLHLGFGIIRAMALFTHAYIITICEISSSSGQQSQEAPTHQCGLYCTKQKGRMAVWLRRRRPGKRTRSCRPPMIFLIGSCLEDDCHHGLFIFHATLATPTRTLHRVEIVRYEASVKAVFRAGKLKPPIKGRFLVHTLADVPFARHRRY